MVLEVEKWSVSRTGSPTKVSEFYLLVGPIKHRVSVKSADYYCFFPCDAPPRIRDGQAVSQVADYISTRFKLSAWKWLSTSL